VAVRALQEKCCQTFLLIFKSIHGYTSSIHKHNSMWRLSQTMLLIMMHQLSIHTFLWLLCIISFQYLCKKNKLIKTTLKKCIQTLRSLSLKRNNSYKLWKHSIITLIISRSNELGLLSIVFPRENWKLSFRHKVSHDNN
jgi:hypothetical protein